MAEPSRPLRMYFPAHGQQMFRAMRDPRLQVCREERGSREPDLVIFPIHQNLRALDQIGALPEWVKARLESGEAGVLFDASQEGRPHRPPNSQALHAALRQMQVDPARAIYVTQNRSYDIGYRAWCAEAGVRPMTVLAYDYWIKKFFSDYETTGEAVFEQRLHAYRARKPARERRFVSLNWTARPTKVLFLLKLLKDRLWDQGFISFGGFSQILEHKGRTLAGFAKDLRALPGFEDMAASLSPLLPRLEAYGEVSFGAMPPEDQPREHHTALVGDLALPEFERSWFSVVTESEMAAQPSRVTEKPFKSLVGFHPTLIFGNPGSLPLLGEFGFQSFAPMFDEAYDAEPDPRRRFDMAYKQVVRLCRMDEAELARREGAISEVLEFNARWGLTRLPGIYRTRIDAELLNAVQARLAAGPVNA